MCASQAEAIGDYGRIGARQVNLSNLDAFEAQIRHDIPRGTSKKAVEAYLVRERIPHGFADASYGDAGNEFYGTLKNIGIRLGFEANLAIRVRLDGAGKVDVISFRVDYDAP
jgi:hypothetical protein